MATDSERQTVLIVDADLDESLEFRKLVKRAGYAVEVVDTLAALEARLSAGGLLAVLLDVDSIPVENRTVRDLVLAHPGVPFLCTSRDKFHPELKDAICYHIFACINKPVDPDELRFWLRCIVEDQARG